MERWNLIFNFKCWNMETVMKVRKMDSKNVGKVGQEMNQ
jgi:hypothetical protein